LLESSIGNIAGEFNQKTLLKSSIEKHCWRVQLKTLLESSIGIHCWGVKSSLKLEFHIIVKDLDCRRLAKSLIAQYKNNWLYSSTWGLPGGIHGKTSGVLLVRTIGRFLCSLSVHNCSFLSSFIAHSQVLNVDTHFSNLETVYPLFLFIFPNNKRLVPSSLMFDGKSLCQTKISCRVNNVLGAYFFSYFHW
jgi:hypothetical protein